MRLIPLAEIASPHGIIEEGRVLVAVIPAPVKIIELEPEAPFLPRIDCKESPEAVFSIGPVACRVIGEDSDRRQRGGELEIVRLHDEHVIRIEEKELRCRPAVDEDTALPGRSEVAQGVVRPVQTGVESGIHEHIRERIGYGRPAVAEAFVYRPYFHAARNLLVLALYGVRTPRLPAVPDAVCGKRAVVVGRVVYDLRHCRMGHQHEEDEQRNKSLHLTDKTE